MLRWSFGDWDTVARSPVSDERLARMVKLAKVSVLSFQRWFDAEFVVGYNGTNLDRFLKAWNSSTPKTDEVTFLNQREYPVLYNFHIPDGVWWKWVPWKYDVNRTEISIDTDIICLNKPQSWHKWLESESQILTCYESIKEICEQTCGDLCSYEILRGRTAINCGIIGQKGEVSVENRFLEITSLVDVSTYNGNFITEQGVFNILIAQLETEGYDVYYLPYHLNQQARDGFYKSVREDIETIHLTADSKILFHRLSDKFTEAISGNCSINSLYQEIWKALSS